MHINYIIQRLQTFLFILAKFLFHVLTFPFFFSDDFHFHSTSMEKTAFFRSQMTFQPF